ncbi:phosphoprotein phosphatase [Leucothrix sargassi]|nr:phosphoprotein phosphatase [Leucothrix sargassi]
MQHPLFKFFPQNHDGRDFVVGDLHGMFHTLEALLESVEFNSDCDRLFSVGDLVDRGPESQRVVEFLEKPWFHAIQGNHEQLLLQSELSESIYDAWTKRAGGKWWVTLSDSERAKIIENISQLPLAFQVSTQAGEVGIIHADIPIGLSWQEFIKQLQHSEELQQHAQWSRIRHRHVTASETIPKIDGIDMVVVGHSIVNEPLHTANIYYIDTGAAYTENSIDSRLTLLQIQPEVKIFQEKTG